jgi:hypothetical protein
MQNEEVKMSDATKALVEQNGGLADSAKASGVYKIQCHDKDGNLKWEAESKNLVVNVGLQDMNTQYFKGAAYTGTFFIGLYGAGASNSPAAGDTMASHAGWTEVTTYSQTTRPAVTFGTATTANPSVINNSASPASYSISGSTTVGGAFVVRGAIGTADQKGGTGGTLYSAADFSAPGDRSVASGDTLTVTYALNLAG